MGIQLTDEMSEALRQSGEAELELVDPATSRRFRLVDADVHRRAMEALRQQEDRDAIACGIAEMNAGLGQPLELALKEICSELERSCSR